MPEEINVLFKRFDANRIKNFVETTLQAVKSLSSKKQIIYNSLKLLKK